MIDYSPAQLDRSLSQLGFRRLIDKPSTSWVENTTTNINLVLGPVQSISFHCRPSNSLSRQQESEKRQKPLKIICSESRN